MWKEALWNNNNEELPWHLPGGAEKKRKKLRVVFVLALIGTGSFRIHVRNLNDCLIISVFKVLAIMSTGRLVDIRGGTV
jgi:hypothetical protein